MKRRCPECGAKHDTRPCRRVAATCDCCRAIYGTRHPATERIPPIDNHAYGLWQPEAPPPDRSWVTTEDITARPRPTRPSPMRPAQWRRVDDLFVVGMGAAALVVVAVVLLLVGTLP